MAARKTADEEIKNEKNKKRDDKIEEIRMKKLQDEVSMAKRAREVNRQNARDSAEAEIIKYAQKLEKQKKIEEEKLRRMDNQMDSKKKHDAIESIENFYANKIDMLRQQIEGERFNNLVSQQAQAKALNDYKRELDSKLKNDIREFKNIPQTAH